MTCYKKYITFSGRAARSEYWYWVLFGILASITCTIIDVILFHPGPTGFFPLRTVIGLVNFLPGLAVAVRRLHDINRSGWWLMLSFGVGVISVPLIALHLIWLLALCGVGLVILFIVWFCAKGTQGDNRFGPDPLQNGPSGG